MQRNLSAFTGGGGLTTTNKFRLIIWAFLQNTIFKSFFFHSKLRVMALRVLGASIGTGVQIRRGVKIHFPWNLTVGNDCWIGEEVWIINHEKVVIGSNVCISQRAVISSGGHNFRTASLEFRHKPIQIAEGAWICMDAKVLPGVVIGKCSVVSAGEIARDLLPDFSMLVSGKIRSISPPQ